VTTFDLEKYRAPPVHADRQPRKNIAKIGRLADAFDTPAEYVDNLEE
jgi:hypothetical protein